MLNGSGGEGSEEVMLTEMPQYRFQLQTHANEIAKFWVPQTWGFSSPKRETAVYLKK